MLLVRFSFCECGSVVCMSPRPAQRSVLASARDGSERERGRERERRAGRRGRIGSWGLLVGIGVAAERAGLRAAGGGDHNAAERAAG